MRAVAVWINRLLWTFIVTAVVGVGALVAISRHYIDYVDDYQQQIVSAISERTGLKLQVGRLSARWVRGSPQFAVRQLTLFNPRNPAEAVLSINRVVVRIGLFPSLARLRPVFTVVDGQGVVAQLDEAAPGQWLLRGFPGGGSFDPIIDALLRIHRADVRAARTRLHFLDGRNATLEISSLQLQRSADFRRLQLTLQPLAPKMPASAPLTLLLEAHGDPRANNFRAQGHAKFSGVDLTPLLPAASSHGIDIAHGRIDGAAWLDWQGRDFSVRGHLALPLLDLAGLKLAGADGALAPVTQISTSFLWRSSEGLHRLWLSNLRAKWGGAALALDGVLLERHPGAPLLTLRTPQLDLARLHAVIRGGHALPERVTTALDELAPQGVLRNVELQLPLAAPRREHLRLRGEVRDLKLSAWHGAPALSGVSGFIDTGVDGGSALLDSAEGQMAFPHVYREPIPFARARGALAWRRDGDRVLVNSGPIDVASDAGTATALLDLNLNIHAGDPVPPQMTLMVGMRNSAAEFRRYFVPFTLPPSLLEWLDRSVGAARLPRGGFLYRGSLRAGDRDNRTVQLFLDVEEGELQPHPDWPALHHIAADVWLDDLDVDVFGRRAAVFDTVELTNIALTMRPQTGGGEWLRVTGDARARDDDLLRLLRESPLQQQLKGALDSWRWNGTARAQVNVGMMIGGEHKRPADIAVNAMLESGTLTLADLNLTLQQVSGPLQYRTPAAGVDKPGLHSAGINARLYQRPAKLSISSDAQHVMDISASGRVAVADLREWLKQPLLDYAQGDAHFDMGIHLNGENSLLRVDSDLAGIAIDLPPPYHKPAEAVLPLQMRMPLRGDRQLTLALADWGDLGLIWAPRDPARPLAPPALESALLRLGGQGSRAPEAGRLVVTGSVPAVDLKPWRELLVSERGELTEVSASNGSGGLAITLRDLVMPEVIAAGLTLRDTHVSGEHRVTGGVPGWYIDAQSDRLQGNVVIPDDATQPLQLTLATLRLPPPEPPADPASATPVPASLLAQYDPATMPAAHVSIGQLWRGDENLGNVGFSLRPLADGLQLENLHGELRGIALQPLSAVPAQLIWRKRGDTHSTRFVGRLAVADIGAVLERWRFERAITSKSGFVDADVSWSGAPDEIGLKKLDGAATLNLTDGRFLKASGSATGALKIVGVFNFTNLLRRLQLDFSDLFSGGVSFDSIEGQLSLNKGVFVTRTPVTITSPSSHFRLAGRIDFNTDLADMELVATLPVASNLPWMVALAGGLPAAAGVYVASKLFQQQVDHFSSAVYEISGPWREPNVKFRRLFDDELPKRPSAPSSAPPAANAPPQQEISP